MLVSIPDFWKLAIESRLLAPEHCQQLALNYEQTKGPLAQSNSKSLADWLVSINVLSKYQAMVLLNGRSGPFYYGEYKVYDRVETGRWKGFFRAVHAPTNHPVLLQFATGAVTQDPQQWAFVVGQVHNRLAAPFPYWHRYYEVVDLGNFKFLVAEDLQGDTVDARLTQVGRIAPPDACVIVRHAALALAQLHRWQMPHGDLRPANLWLDAHGHCRLLQDPTVIPSPFPQGVTDSDGSLAARADYAAPELSQAGRMPDAQTDVYALGCCFYQMLTGRPPFAGGDIASKFQRHQAEPIQSLAPLGVPDPLAQLIAYMMAKNPGTRFPQAQIVADQLAPFVDPARLNVASVTVPPTLPGYEQFVQQRGQGRTSAAYLPATMPAPATPAPATPAPAAPAPAPAAPAPASAAVAPAPAATPPAMTPATAKPVTAATPKASVATPPAGAPSAAKPVAPQPVSGSPAAVSRPGAAANPASGGGAVGAPPVASSGARSAPASRPAAASTASPARPTAVPQPTGPASTKPVPAPSVGTRPQPVAAQGGGAPAAVSAQAGAPAGGAPKRAGNNILLWGGIGGGVLFLLVLVLVVVMNSGGDSSGESGATDGNTQVAANGAATAGAGTTPASTGSSNSAAGTGKVSPGANTPVPGTTGVGAGSSGAGTGTRPNRGPTPPVPETAAPKGLQQTVVPDDGKSLWESPTTGAPVEFQWVPPGGQVFVLLRPSDMSRTIEGARVLRAMGPALTSQLADWEKAAGVPFASVESLIITLHDNGEEFPRPSFVVRLAEEVSGGEWAERWKSEEAGESARAALFSGGGYMYCVPKTEGNRLFVMGAKEDIEEAAKMGGAPPALRREVDRLRRMTDDQRHLTILFAPNYLASTMFRDGRSFYFGEARRVREPLDWFLRDELQGAVFSLHTAGDTYLELRLTSNLNKDRFTLAKEFQDRLEQVPDLAFDYIATLGSNPYWERVRLQFPNMIRFLHGKTRIGVEEDTATINARLPGPAAHNLVFGSEMLLMSNPGASPVAVASKPMPMAGNMGGMSPASMTIDDILGKYKTNVSFEAMSIEHALLDLAKGVNEDLKGLPFEFKIKVAGEDLRLDGITRNQTVRDFMQKDRTIGEILTAMVMKANPVTTVKEPSEKDQKLLWVVEKDPEDPTKTIVLVTTRAVSEQKGYKLPAVFQLK